MKKLYDDNLTLEEAEELIKNGADVNQIMMYGYTPLFYAKNVSIIQLLIDHGADVNEINDYGYSLIHWSQYNIDIIDVFIANGINMNMISNNGDSPLDANDSKDEVKILIDNGSVPGKIETYQYYRHLFTKEQQNAFDTFASITSHDHDFFQLCLAYQKNNVKIGVKDIDII